MTIEEIKASRAHVLTPSDIAEIIGSNPATLRLMAIQTPEHLNPLAPIRTGNRVKFPRIRFLRWYYGPDYTEQLEGE